MTPFLPRTDAGSGGRHLERHTTGAKTMRRLAGRKADRIKDRAAMVAAVETVVSEAGGRRTDSDEWRREYEVPTPVGLLTINVFNKHDETAWIAQKFDDPERVMAQGWPVVRSNGKWNFHADDCTGDQFAAFVADWVRQMRVLLATTGAPAPADRWEVVDDAGEVLANRLTEADARQWADRHPEAGGLPRLMPSPADRWVPFYRYAMLAAR